MRHPTLVDTERGRRGLCEVIELESLFVTSLVEGSGSGSEELGAEARRVHAGGGTGRWAWPVLLLQHSGRR